MKVAEVMGAIGVVLDKYETELATPKRLQKRRDRVRGLVVRHQAVLTKLSDKLQKAFDRVNRNNPYGRSAFLQPLANAVLTKFPGMAVEIAGPFGLSSTSSITIYDPALGPDHGEICWLQFRFNNETRELSFVDYSQNTGDFPEGSIGAVNGLNYPSVVIDPAMSLDDLVAKFKPCAAKEPETC